MQSLDFLFRRLLPAGALAVGATVLAVGWFTQPDRFEKGYAPAQPIPFSHELHAGTLSISCAYCHSGAWKSPVAGLPPVELCMDCHRVTRTGDPAIRKLTRVWETGGTLRWKRVHTLPDHVAFDHRPHVLAGIACQSCHGEVQTQAVTERRMNLRMGACVECHRHPGRAVPPGKGRPVRGPEHCSACHR